LIHPNKTGSLAAVRFSPDGKRIIAGDYPGGVVALWDVASGKRLTTIETGHGLRASSEYFAVSPDWRTLFAWREKRKYERVEQDGKRMMRWTFDGDIRVWNLDDGKLIRTYKQKPPHNIRFMRLAPSGEMFYTHDELPGTYEGGPKGAISLWDVKTGTSRTLDGRQNAECFSPDGRTLTLTVNDEDGYVRALKLIDVASGREKWSRPITEKYAWLNVHAFTPDGRLMFGTLRVFEARRKYDAERCWLKWWDAATGREVASLEEDNKDIFSSLRCSPDGQMLAAVNWHWKRLSTQKLFLYSVPEKRLLRTVILGEKKEGMRPLASSPVFSPDGKWLAVITRTYPEKTVGDDLDARDVPQPRILLIETATGEIRETMIAPQGFSNDACFSPDGRTLATGGLGRVLLWDMTEMPE
jgi:WD40 repeat protein